MGDLSTRFLEELLEKKEVEIEQYRTLTGELKNLLKLHEEQTIMRYSSTIAEDMAWSALDEISHKIQNLLNISHMIDEESVERHLQECLEVTQKHRGKRDEFIRSKILENRS